MKLTWMGLSLIVCGAVLGCGSSGQPPEQTVGHWFQKVPPGTTAGQATQTFRGGGFQTWNSGRTIYAYRDADYPIANSDGVSMHAYVDPDNRVLSADGYESPKNPYPLLLPTYP